MTLTKELLKRFVKKRLTLVPTPPALSHALAPRALRRRHSLGTTSAVSINALRRRQPACGPRPRDITSQTRPRNAAGADGTSMVSALGINMAP